MRAILVILDGLGVGGSDRRSEARCNTLRSVVAATGCVLPTLDMLGMARLEGPRGDKDPIASYGRSALAYTGADSYLGHQEIFGVIPPPPSNVLLEKTSGRIRDNLKSRGHRVSELDGGPALLVDESILIADNLEAAPGQALNLIGSTRQATFERIEEIGFLIRPRVPNSRVIVCGGTGFDVGDLRRTLSRDTDGRHGVSTPSIGLYDDSFQVRHIGLPVDAGAQVHTRLARRNVDVTLIGKVADLIGGEASHRSPVSGTDAVIELLDDWVDSGRDGLAAATIQETDLAGHEQDPVRYAAVLESVDRWLAGRIDDLGENDLLLITADHGNDPVHGGGHHSREKVPILRYRLGAEVRDLGTRSTLADAAAAIAHHFDVSWAGDGTDLDLETTGVS